MFATILVIEGHAALRGALRRWLEIRFPDCHLVEATSVTKAILMAQARPPEVIIMDIGLSEMGYLEALEQIKTVAPAPQMVVLTNYEEEEVQCTLATANEKSIYFLWKNNMLTELEPILAALLLPRQNGVTSKFAVALPGMG